MAWAVLGFLAVLLIAAPVVCLWWNWRGAERQLTAVTSRANRLAGELHIERDRTRQLGELVTRWGLRDPGMRRTLTEIRDLDEIES